jgi:flagellar basal body-associated protein FliL
MNEDVSRMVIVIVMILAIIISSYLTFMAFKYKSSLNEDQRIRNTVQSAQVTLTVVAPEQIEELQVNLSNESDVG